MQDRTLDNGHLDKACQRVGKFMYHFAKLEGVVDRIIQSARNPEYAHRQASSGHVFLWEKLSNAQSLISFQVQKDRSWKVSTVAALEQVSVFSNFRNMIAHAQFRPASEGRVEFLQKGGNVTWGNETFADTYSGIYQLYVRLSGICDEILPLNHQLFLYDFHHNIDDPTDWILELKALATEYFGSVHECSPGKDQNDLPVVTISSRSKGDLEACIRAYYVDEDEDFIQEQIDDIREIWSDRHVNGDGQPDLKFTINKVAMIIKSYFIL